MVKNRATQPNKKITPLVIPVIGRQQLIIERDLQSTEKINITKPSTVHSDNKIALYELSPKENTMNQKYEDLFQTLQIDAKPKKNNQMSGTAQVLANNNSIQTMLPPATTSCQANSSSIIGGGASTLTVEDANNRIQQHHHNINSSSYQEQQTVQREVNSPPLVETSSSTNINTNRKDSEGNESSLSSSSTCSSNESLSSSGKSSPDTTTGMTNSDEQLVSSLANFSSTHYTSTNNVHTSATSSYQSPSLNNTSNLPTTETSKKVRVSVSDNPAISNNANTEDRRNSIFGSPTEPPSATSPQFNQSSNNSSFMQGDSAMILNEKLHQIFLPICLFLCYAYLIVYSTDYPISMSFLCIIAIVINFKYVRNLVQQRLVVWLIKHLSKDAATLGEIVEHEDLGNSDQNSTFIQQPTTPLPPTSSGNTSSDAQKEPNTVPFYSSSDFWRFGSVGSSSTSSTRASSSSSNGLPVDASYLAAKKQRLLEVYTCKVMIVVNIAVFFLRLLLCTKDYTVGWLMIGFLSSTVHNYSYIILQNALVDCRVHSYEAIMWVILSQHIVSVGIAIILSIVHHRYVEAFGTFCLLTVLNFMLNSVSYKLMNRLNTMKLMTSKLKEANRSKNALVSSISHEFRSPLMSISGSIELLLDTTLNAEQINYIKTIGSCSSILLTLIEDILQYSKLEKTNMEIATNSMLGKNTNNEEKVENHKTVFSLSDCLQHVRSIASSYASNFDVTIDFVTSKFLPSYVLGESVRLQQVLINLLTNSIKASSRNQVVTLAVEVLEDDNPEDIIDDGRSNAKEIVVVKRKDLSSIEPSSITSTSTDSSQLQQETPTIKTVVFKVIDHGCGIQKDIQKLLFKPFSSHNHNGDGSVIGTGLGLTILRKIIINMKGGISYRTLCEPSPNHGTTFCISIPFHLPDKKKKNSLKQIEEILRTNPIVNQSMSTESMTSSSGTSTSLLDSHSKKSDDLGTIASAVNSIDSEIQKTHLLHKELYMMKKRQSKSSTTASPKHSLQDSSSISTTGSSTTMSTTTTNSTMTNTTDNTSSSSTSSITTPITSSSDIFETKILLAEDNPINLSVLKKLLQKGGFKNITTSANGFELIEAFRKEYHPIIVTDLHMPIINGIDAANEIRSLPYGDKVKIILLTADALMDKFNNMDSIDSCLNKPISKDDLNQAIVSAIRMLQSQE